MSEIVAHRFLRGTFFALALLVTQGAAGTETAPTDSARLAQDEPQGAAGTETAPADSLVLELDSALRILIKNNADVQDAKYSWIVQAEVARGTYGEFEPHLVGKISKERADKPSALFTETKDEYQIALKGKLPTATEYNVGFNQATYTHSEYTSELYFGAELRQHILKDGLLYFSPTGPLREARLQQEIAYQKYRNALNEILDKFYEAYWNYSYAEQTLQFATKSAQVAKQIADDAGKRQQLGILSMLDLQKATAEYSDRESARLSALDQLRNARMNLLLTLSSRELLIDPRPIAIAAPPEPDTAASEPALMAEDSVCRMHPAYLQQQAELSLREEEVKQHRTRSLPTVDIVGNYGIRSRHSDARRAVRDFKNAENRQTVLSGGIEIDIPLFANMYERHQIAAEKTNVRAARTRLALIRNKLFEEYRNLLKRSVEIREQWRLSKIAVTYHESELKEEFKKMELGKSNYHLIFDAEEDLRKAEQRHLENMRDMRLIDVKLLIAKGELLRENGLESWEKGTPALRKELLDE